MVTIQRILIVLVISLFQAVSGLAAPSLPVVRPMVLPELSFTGPTLDTHAVQGQWFSNVTSSVLENRTHEFYDNTPITGGGAMGHLAISGVVVSVVTEPIVPFGEKIVAFDVMATVFNDASTGSGAWTNGINSHDEITYTQERYTNAFERIILTVDFATIYGKWFGDAPPPYADTFQTRIVAVNHDYAGWFCWNPARTNTLQYGDFFVPGWDMGELPVDQSTNRLLHFAVYDRSPGLAGITSDDPRYEIIMNSSNNQTDIFINRSSSLKISTWISTPSYDDGNTDYPVDGDHFLGNVSVFHNIKGDPAVAITSAGFQSAPPAIWINSAGSSGVVMQILQSSTNLMTNTWVNIATNLSWPLPKINAWTNAISGTNSVNFFRIVQ